MRAPDRHAEAASGSSCGTFGKGSKRMRLRPPVDRGLLREMTVPQRVRPRRCREWAPVRSGAASLGCATVHMANLRFAASPLGPMVWGPSLVTAPKTRRVSRFGPSRSVSASRRSSWSGFFRFSPSLPGTCCRGLSSPLDQIPGGSPYQAWLGRASPAATNVHCGRGAGAAKPATGSRPAASV